MSAAPISLEHAEGIFRLTLRRPEALNALSTEMCVALAGALGRVDQDPGARVLILTGEGRAFCAGADLKEREGASPDAIWAHNRRIFGIPRLIEHLQVPALAAINGFALGGGCELALACDMRWAATHAEFGCPEVTRGIIPAAGGTQRLPRLVGTSRAMALILGGRRIGAQEANRIGLVDAVVEPDDLLRIVEETARMIAGNAPLAVRAAKLAMRYGMEHPLEAGLDLEGQLQRMLYASADCQEGITAFRERRAPRWSGR
jgi:enoyl-CoA hydratase/carnithine racemase